MNESFYIISCWLHNRKGASFIVELRDANDRFFGVRQDEASGTIEMLRQAGTVDRSLPFRRFDVSADLVFQLLERIQSQSIPMVPTMTGGFDGANYHIRIKNGESFSEFSWWMSCPKEWAPLQVFWDEIVAMSM
jgi:hypothetical protein